MITFVFGTTGELIKIFPLLTSLDSEGRHYELWCTGQQLEEIPMALDSLGLTKSIKWIAKGSRGHSLHTSADVLLWLGKVFLGFSALLPSMWRRRKNSIVIVHGDTMTTAISALFSRIGLTAVAHIEAGMRSGDLRNPFPEELSRRFVAKIAKLNYAPGLVAVENLRNSKGEIVDTHYNTIVDALKIANSTNKSQSANKFGLVSLHRSELYESRSELENIVKILVRHSKTNRLIFIDHPVTAKKITDYGLNLDLSSGLIERQHKLNYFEFISLLAQAEYVITDSGGLQQECAITGHPCLVHRAVTESFEGVGENIVISKLDTTIVENFLTDPQRFRTQGTATSISPTEIIISDLSARGFLSQK